MLQAMTKAVSSSKKGSGIGIDKVKGLLNSGASIGEVQDLLRSKKKKKPINKNKINFSNKNYRQMIYGKNLIGEKSNLQFSGCHRATEHR